MSKPITTIHNNEEYYITLQRKLCDLYHQLKTKGSNEIFDRCGIKLLDSTEEYENAFEGRISFLQAATNGQENSKKLIYVIDEPSKLKLLEKLYTIFLEDTYEETGSFNINIKRLAQYIHDQGYFISSLVGLKNHYVPYINQNSKKQIKSKIKKELVIIKRRRNKHHYIEAEVATVSHKKQKIVEEESKEVIEVEEDNKKEIESGQTKQMVEEESKEEIEVEEDSEEEIENFKEKQQIMEEVSKEVIEVEEESEEEIESNQKETTNKKHDGDDGDSIQIKILNIQQLLIKKRILNKNHNIK